MSQDVSTTMNKVEMDAGPAEADAVATAVMNPEFSPETFSVDNYADRLMDEVFNNVDHLLETGQDLEEEATAVAVEMPTIQMPDMAPLSVVAESPLAETEEDEDAEEDTSKPEPKQADWSIRILFGLALVSLAGATAVVATQWQSYRTFYLQMTGQAASPAATQTIAAAPTAPSPNQQFATYVQRSLEVLKDQTAIGRANGTMAIPTPSAVLQVPPATIPTVASASPAVPPVAPIAPIAPAAAVPPSAGTNTIIERIYIPVYQTASGYVPVNPNQSISPEAAAAGIPQPGQPEAPQAIAAATQQSNPVQPGTVPAVAPSEQGVAGDSFITPAVPVVEHTLVGLLELGNSSAALFEVEGVTRRFSLGEQVGGWTLAEVKNGEALLRKDGEVRSVFVGQTF